MQLSRVENGNRYILGKSMEGEVEEKREQASASGYDNSDWCCLKYWKQLEAYDAT